MFRSFANIGRIVKDKKIKIEYPKGYKHWRKRFEDEYAKTKNVGEALNSIHGKKGGDSK